jgi:hypothetical protein
MTRAEQIAALQQFGYTAREASFLTLAALHSGSFLRRQFCAARGKSAESLVRKVMALEHARTTVYARNTHLYHLFAKPLYTALGQTNNRHRRERDSFYLRAKVMGLDYVLMNQDYHYLPTEQEKLAYFCDDLGIGHSHLPTKTYSGKDGSRTQRYFVDKYPVRIDPETRKVAFCYIDDSVFTPPGFPTWLAQYGPLVHALGEAEIVYVSAAESGFAAGRAAFAKQFPGTDGAAPVDLLEYFELRQDFELRGAAGRPQEALDLFRRLSRRYAERRFQAQYAAWKNATTAPAKVSKIGFSTFLLPFSYKFFGAGGGGKSNAI